MAATTELSSPQNKLKDIFHTIFKRHDASQVARELTQARVCQENADATPTGPDALTTSDHAAGTAATAYGDLGQSAEPLAAPQQLQDQGPHQQKSCSSHQQDSALMLDSGGAAAPAVAHASAVPVPPQQLCPGSDPSAALTQPQCTAPFTPHAAADVSLCVLGHSTSSSDGAGADAGPAQTAASCMPIPTSSEQRTPQHSSAEALQDDLQAFHEPSARAAAAKAYVGPDGLPLTSCHSSGTAQRDTLQQQEHAWPHALPPACPATIMHSEPAPNGSSAGCKPGGQRRVNCASVDDLYQELFGDVPLPSASSSAAQSPYGNHLGSIRGLSSMSPMTTNSAFCHQQAAAAAIAGSGGMPGMGAFIPFAAASPVPCVSNSMGDCYEGGSRGSPYGVVGGSFEDCGIVGPRVQQQAVMDDMLPPGAFPPRIRTVAEPPPNPSRFSGSDGCSSSQFADDTPSCCSSSAGGVAWPAVSTEEGVSQGGSVAVSSMGSARGWGSRGGSTRYSSPQHHSGPHSMQAGSRHGSHTSPSAPAQRRHTGQATAGSMSAPGSADGKPAPKSTLRARWSNWINGGSSSAGGTPGRNASSLKQLQVQQQQQQDEQVSELPEPSAPWLAQNQAGASPKQKPPVFYAQSAPGNAAAQALHNSMAGAYGGSAGASAAPMHQLMHCHSNPERVHSAASGLGGLQGRAHFQRTSALGGNVPPCARALFGSVPQMERPLMMAGSVGNGGSNSSSGWLCGPGGVGFGVLPRSESFPVLSTLDDAVSVASADEEVIRQVNADNVLSSAWGPGSQSASGAAGQSAAGAHPLASHPKLLAFKYCCATSPLNHPGRASPFNSARNSPFNSPRGTREGVIDLMPLRTAVAAAATAASAASSCPGSPLGLRHSNTFGNMHTSTPGAAASLPSVANSDGAATAAAAAAADSKASQQQLQLQTSSVLKMQVSSNSQQQLENQQLEGTLSTASELATACSSSGGSNSSSKPPLQSRPTRGLLRTPPPPVLALRQQSPAAAALEAVTSTPGSSCAAADAAGGDLAQGDLTDGCVLSMQPGRGFGCNTGPSSSSSRPDGSNRRASAPSGLSTMMMRFGSSSGSSKGSSNPEEAHQDAGAVTAAAVAAAVGADAGEAEVTEPPAAAVMTRSGSSHSSSGGSGVFSRAGLANSVPPLPLPLASSVDAGSPKALQQQQSIGTIGGAESRSSPRRQSSSRLGASGFTTPSRLSHNSTMAEALVNGSGGAGAGGFALQRTSSCCSSSSGWPGPGAEGNRSCGRSSNGYGVHALPGHDGLLSTTSVPLPNVYSASTRSVNSSDSSDGSWAAGPEAAPGSAAAAAGDEQQQIQQQKQQQRTAHEPAAAAAAYPAAAAGVGRYGSSCNGASDISAADAQECAYPSWCSSSSWSPLIPDGHQQQQQQQSRQQQAESGQRQHSGTPAEAAAAAAAVDNASTQQASSAGETAGEDCDDEQAGPIPPSLPEVDFLEKIGRGSFGDVFKGVWCGSVVAVKVIQVKQPSALTFPNRPPTSHQQRSPSSDLRSNTLGDTATVEAAAASTGPSEIDSQAAQVALELAQHEYESWLNANLRHPNIVQLFTSFTIGLQEHSPAVPMLSCGGDADLSRGALQVLGEAGGSGGLSWKTHLVMEYCELGTMQDLLQQGVFSQGTLPPSCHSCWALATAKEFCTAVAYLHSMDVVHGDLKSSNVLLKAAAVTPWDSRGFVAKVSDFGLSRVMDAISAANGEPPLTPSAAASPDLTHNPAAEPQASSAAAAAGAAPDSTGGGSGGCGGAAAGAGGSLGWGQPCQPRFGALSHAAPELIRGDTLSKASDVYSVGVLLWELLTGQAPFYGMHPGQLLSRKLSQHTSQLLHFPAWTPPCLVQLCLDCWADRPARRPTMAVVVQRINDLAVTLLGQQQAVAMFPDVAASLAAQRRQAAIAAVAVGGSS